MKNFGIIVKNFGNILKKTVFENKQGTIPRKCEKPSQGEDGEASSTHLGAFRQQRSEQQFGRLSELILN